MINPIGETLETKLLQFNYKLLQEALLSGTYNGQRTIALNRAIHQSTEKIMRIKSPVQEL